MTEMDLGNLGTADFSNSEKFRMVCLSDPVGLVKMREHFLSYLCWPNSKKLREEYLATRGAMEIAHVRAKIKGFKTEYAFDDWPTSVQEIIKNRQNDILERIRQQLFDPYGAEAAVAAAVGTTALNKQITQAFSDILTVGHFVHILTQMRIHHENELRGGASESKAIDLLVWINSRRGTGPQKRKIQALVKSYRPLLPVSASFLRYLIASSDISDWRVIYTEGLFGILAYGKAFEQFLRTFQGHGEKKPRYKDANFLSPPATMVLPKIEDLSPPALAKEELDYLHQRLRRSISD